MSQTKITTTINGAKTIETTGAPIVSAGRRAASNMIACPDCGAGCAPHGFARHNGSQPCRARAAQSEQIAAGRVTVTAACAERIEAAGGLVVRANSLYRRGGPGKCAKFGSENWTAKDLAKQYEFAESTKKTRDRDGARQAQRNAVTVPLESFFGALSLIGQFAAYLDSLDSLESLLAVDTQDVAYACYFRNSVHRKNRRGRIDKTPAFARLKTIERRPAWAAPGYCCPVQSVLDLLPPETAIALDRALERNAKPIARLAAE